MLFITFTMSKRYQTFLKLIVGVIVAVAGNSITTLTEKDKDYHLLIATEAAAYVRSGRFNVDFSEELVKRADLMSQWLTLKVLEEGDIAALKDLLPTAPSTAQVESTFKAFQSIKEFCRNLYGAKYERDKKALPSGTYDDSDILRKIMALYHSNRIDVNFAKKVSADWIAYKTSMGAGFTAGPAEKAAKLKEFEDKCRDKYDKQKAEWIDCDPAPELLAFIFCSYPGKRFTSLVVTEDAPQEGKTKQGRKSLREGKVALAAAGSAQGKTALDESLLGVRKRDVEAKEVGLKFMAYQSKKDSMQELLKIMREESVQDSDEYKALYAEYKLLLKQQATSSL